VGKIVTEKNGLDQGDWRRVKRAESGKRAEADPGREGTGGGGRS